MLPAERNVREAIRENGLTLVSLRQNKHLHFLVRRADGTERTFHFSVTPSCNRVAQKNRVMLRRFAQGLPYKGGG